MAQPGRGGRGRGYGGRGSGGRYSGRGDSGGRGSGWQQGGRGEHGSEGDDAGQGGGHGGRGGRGGASLRQVNPVAGHERAQSSGSRQDGRGHRGMQGDEGPWGGRHGDHQGQGHHVFGDRGTVRPVNPAVGSGAWQPQSAPASVGAALTFAQALATGSPGPSAWGRGGGSGVGAWDKPMAAGTANIPPATETTTAGSVAAGVERLTISPAPSPSPPCLPSADGKLVPIERPDEGGSMGRNNTMKLRVNHFRLCTDKIAYYQYDVDVQPNGTATSSAVPMSKSNLSAVKRELFRTYAAQFPQSTAYDGQRNLFTPEPVSSEGPFRVSVRGQEFNVELRFVRQVSSRELTQTPCPREILQGLDVIFRENSSRDKITIGRCFYFRTGEKDLGAGAVALQGFQQSIKSTEQGLVLSVDHSAMAFFKPIAVMAYLEERLGRRFEGHTPLDDRVREMVRRELVGLKVEVTHRQERRRFTVFGLTDKKADDISFTDDKSGSSLSLVHYYWDRYNMKIKYKLLPCLQLSKDGKILVPMELCKLVEGQRLPKEKISKNGDSELRNMRLSEPSARRSYITKTMESENGPARGSILGDFHVSIRREMAAAEGRVLDRPSLRLCNRSGNSISFNIRNADGQWNLLQHKLLSGREIGRWRIADFTPSRRRPDGVPLRHFFSTLSEKCSVLGSAMNPEPAFYRKCHMDDMFYPDRLRGVLNEAMRATGGLLQILFCPMAEQHEGYKTLKLIAETEVGILTQCCLSRHAEQCKDQYLTNLGLKINGKLGGSNFELFNGPTLPGNDAASPAVLIGADVNHPSSFDVTSPSIAAVVGTVNWPAANRYISEVRAQPHRRESIMDVGPMCKGLIDKYAGANNGARPKRIIYYRDGVSDSQFDMVLNEELRDIKAAIVTKDYTPRITVVVAQKRHQTRLFPENRNDLPYTKLGNVPPGTVVDRGIVVPCLFNFFLCSHNGILGTSKPTHYYVLWDENGFTSDSMQKLTYDLCFTFSRCTKPVSLVPPVYYADLLAYRGRQYHEAMLLQRGSPSSASTPEGASGRIPELHANIKDAMYFI